MEVHEKRESVKEEERKVLKLVRVAVLETTKAFPVNGQEPRLVNSTVH